MAFLIALATVLLIVVLAHAAAGWIVASGLHEAMLAVREPDSPPRLAVRHVSPARITLQAAGPRQEIGHPGVIGLRWDSGYGQVGEVVDADGSLVTRDFELLEGGLPPVCEDTRPLDDCPPVIPDAYAFPNGPEDVGLAYDNITYSSPLGPMGAWLVPSRGATWAIHVHGWTADRREAVRTLRAFHRAGITSMVIDYRNDPGAPTDPSGRYRFGLEEWADVEAAMAHAVATGADGIVCMGYSTGAAHVLSFLERSRLSGHVKGLILDAPNVALAETVRHNWTEMRLPVLGWMPNRLAVELGMSIADLRWGIDWDGTNYVQRAREIIEVPTLLFHGTSDHRVPISISRRLEAALPHLVNLRESPAAGHVMSWNADPRSYEDQLERFLGGLQN